MRTSKKKSFELKVAENVAGEDLRKGDFVSPLIQVYELPSFLWTCSAETLPASEPVRFQCSANSSGTPYKVEEVCLPFVYAKAPKGNITIFDLRRHRMVRLERESGQRMWKSLSKSK